MFSNSASALVSIIVPSYNMADLLPRTIESCVAQDHRPIEVIVVDDGSTDDTYNVVLNLPAAIPIRYIRIPHHGAPSRPRNVGFRVARGIFIQFLDADDLLAPNKISRQVSLLSPHLSVTSRVAAYCDYRFFSGDPPADLRRIGPDHCEPWPHSFLEQFHLYTVHHRFLYPKSLFETYGVFDESMTHAEDLDLWMRLLIQGVTFVYDPEPMALYRERVGVSRSNPGMQIKGYLRALDNAEQLLIEKKSRQNYAEDIDTLRRELRRKLILLNCGKLQTE